MKLTKLDMRLTLLIKSRNRIVQCPSSQLIFCVLQDRAPGEPFVPKSSKEAEMEKLLKSMEVVCFLNLFLSLRGRLTDKSSN